MKFCRSDLCGGMIRALRMEPYYFDQHRGHSQYANLAMELADGKVMHFVVTPDKDCLEHMATEKEISSWVAISELDGYQLTGQIVAEVGWSNDLDTISVLTKAGLLIFNEIVWPESSEPRVRKFSEMKFEEPPISVWDQPNWV